MKICAVAGCRDTAKTRGWCTPHYQEQWRSGSLPRDKPRESVNTEMLAQNSTLPLWLRIGLFTMEHHDEPFEPGELAMRLSDVHPLTPEQVDAGITEAIEWKLIGQDSTALMLLVPEQEDTEPVENP